MKITRLQLKFYKRLLLNNIINVDYKPENKLQLILGTNGSGKSSLLKELSPLPANKNEYEKGGYKIIEIAHKNSQYILTSNFTDKTIYSFMKDGEELNQGYTVSVYKQLVKSEFNIDTDIQDILLSQYRFHEMSPLERRNWFTKISSCDYTYAIGYYQRLKDEFRDSQAAIKLIQSRIVNEKQKLLDDTQETTIRKELSALNEYLNFILDSKPNINNDQITINNIIMKLEEKMKDNVREVRKLRKSFLNIENFESESDIDDLIIRYRSDILSLENTFNYLCQSIEKERKIEEAYLASNINSVDDINSSFLEISTSIGNEEGKKNKSLFFSDPVQALTALQTISDQLLYIANNIPKSSGQGFSSIEIQTNRTKLNFIKLKLKEYTDAQDIVIQKKKELEHYKGHGETECPVCKHRWYKGYDEKLYTDILKTLEKNSLIIKNFEDEIIQIDKYLESANEYLRLRKIYEDIYRSWELLKPLFNYLNSHNVFNLNPEKIKHIITDVEQDLIIDINILKLRNKLADLDKLKKTINETKENDLDKIKVAILDFNKQLYKVNLELDDKRRYLNKLLYYKNVIKRFKDIEVEINDLINKRDNILRNEILVNKRDKINDIIKLTRIEISNREQLISNVNIQKAIVSDLESQLKINITKYDLLKIALRKLSPNEGLIAKGLTGFINHFLLELNLFIKKIWLYPLEILPVKIDDDNQLDLTYDFKVKINDNNVIPDISKASSAMKEVIDLAFKVISMKYLGLEEFPIYLDEFAASFDKEHRQKAYAIINSLINNSNYSQIFTISHYEDCYGSFVNTDIIVLCSNNIPIPKDSAFNKVISLL